MAIEFKREILNYRFLDARKDFEENVLSFERRSDPLTHNTCYLYTSDTIGTATRVFNKPDLSEMVEKSPAVGCPFCPQLIDKVATKFTPDFVPEGRIYVGESIVLPQAIPYATYGAVTVLSSQHFIGLEDFTEELLTNGFLASQSYLQRVFEYDRRVKYGHILWNYMPPSGASQLHPHLQTQADNIPSNFLKELLEESKRYYGSNGTNYWSDLIAKEIDLEERYIGTIGDVCWLSAFAPKSVFGMDVIAVFQGKSSILDLSRQDLIHFSQGLMSYFRCISDQNLYSFNLCIYSGTREADYFWTHAMILPRTTFGPLNASDISAHHTLLGKSTYTFQLPENTCKELKKYFTS